MSEGEADRAPRRVRRPSEPPAMAEATPARGPVTGTPARERREVKRLQGRGQAVLVEFADGGRPRRVILPADRLGEDGTASVADLEAGIPYGLPWETARIEAPTPDALADALRNAGIWTAEDLHRSPGAAMGALQAVYRMGLDALNRFAAECESAQED